MESSNKELSPVEVNKKIQSKFCKVITPYGEGTGYFVDDEKGLLLTSFHLVGQIKPIQYKIENDNDFKIITILSKKGYLDSQFRVESKISFEMLSKINLELDFIIQSPQITFHMYNLFNILVTPEQAFKISNDVKIQEKVFELFEKKTYFDIKSDSDLKIICILLCKDLLFQKDGSNFYFKDINIKRESISNILKIHSNFSMNLNNFIFKDMIISVTPEEAKNLNEDPIVSKKLNSFFSDFLYKKEITYLPDEIEIEYDNQRLFGKVLFPKTHDGNKVLSNYAFFDTAPIQITSFEDGTLFSDKIKILDTGDKIDFLPKEDHIEIGEKIYFGGFPLGHEEYTFSIGMVSSIICKDNRTQIVIEAPIAPGHSGCPTFIQRNGKLYYVGGIISEIAVISDKLLNIRQLLKTAPEYMPLIDTNNNKKITDLTEILKELTEGLMGNLSTGKGKALQIQGLETLWNIDNQPYLVDRFLDFSVGKNTSPPKALKLFEYINKKKTPILTGEDLHDYLCNWSGSDPETRKMIFSQVSYQKDWKAHIFINAMLNDDILPNNLNIEGQGPDQNKLRTFYKYIFRVSNGKLKNNQIVYTDEDALIYKDAGITRKFYIDHIIGKNRKEQSKKSKEKASERFKLGKVTVSTVLAENSLNDLNNEVKNSQDFYKAAEQKTIETIPNNSYIKSLFFKTQEAHRLIEYKKETKEYSTNTKSHFFYSVAKKGDSFFIHHFARIEPKPEWNKLTLEEPHNKREAYFTQGN